MKSKKLTFAIGIVLLVVLAIPTPLAAQGNPTRYRIIELPTLGGPTSYPS